MGCHVLLLLASLVYGDQELLLDRPPHLLEMNVHVRPDTLAMGDTMTILISVTSREPEIVQLRFPTGCPFAFRVTAPDGTPVEVDRGCRLGRDTLALMPGETAWDTLTVAVAVPRPATERPDSASRGEVVHPAGGMVADPLFEPPPRVEWPARGERIVEGVFRIEGGIRGQEFRWAAVDVFVR